MKTTNYRSQKDCKKTGSKIKLTVVCLMLFLSTLSGNILQAGNIMRVKITGCGYTDETVFRNLATATTGFDGAYDAYKLFSPDVNAPSIYSTDGTNLYSINSQPINHKTVFEVPVKVGISGTYTMSVTGIANFDSLYMVDISTGTLLNLKIDSVYTFTMQSSYIGSRFAIAFGDTLLNNQQVNLPVTFVSLKGINESNGNKIEWVTANEKDNDYFSLEKSEDGKSFELLEKIEGSRTANTQNNYQFLDHNPFPRVTYYRLKQVDFNGDYDYSDLIVVHTSEKVKRENVLQAGPNPLTSELDLHFEIDSTNEINIQLIDELGNTIISEKKSIDNAQIEMNYFVGELKTGLYFLMVKDNNNIILLSQKMVKI